MANLSGGPEHPAGDEGFYLRDFKFMGLVAEGTIEDPGLVVNLFHRHRHLSTLDPGEIFGMEGAFGEPFAGGIDQHVVLLGFDFKIRQSPDDGVVADSEVYGPLLHVIGVGDELGAGDELVSHISAKGVSHPAVETGNSDSGLGGFDDPLGLLFPESSHRPVRNDEILFGNKFPIGEGIELALNGDFESFLSKNFFPENGGCFRAVSFPTTGENDR